MLQLNIQPYASDALEDAMRLAQVKALNSFSWSDCLNYLNYAWMDMYQMLALLDEGYYSRTMQIKQRLTKLPAYVKNSIKVYAAQSPIGFNRDVFRASGYNDLNGYSTYHISGFDLYCPDAEHRTVWLNYVPAQPQIFFTHHNRDPKIYGLTEQENTQEKLIASIKEQSNVYNLHTLDIREVDGVAQYVLVNRNITVGEEYDITDNLIREDWDIVYISCDFPYIFITYRHKYTNEYNSGFYRDILNTSYEFIEYNPFAYTGRNSNVEYLKCKWNDKTGLGVFIIDHNDQDRIKELGWTPDSLLTYPCPEMYRLLVARLADKLASLNESNVMGVAKELVEAEYAFKKFTAKDKSSWIRIDNVNGPTVADLL